LHALSKEIGCNHELALALWESGYHEARAIAAKIADPKRLTKKLMESWVKDFDSWDICDGTCLYYFRKYPDAYHLAFSWAERKSEFVRRAGFVLMAVLAVHDKKRDDHDFLLYFPLISKYASDERNFVKKAVNWALRQIGKRSEFLRNECIQLAEQIREQDSRAAKWVAADAIRELQEKKIAR
jgi:3-methyladenine DNA glycosylase AlkD